MPFQLPLVTRYFWKQSSLILKKIYKIYKLDTPNSCPASQKMGYHARLLGVLLLYDYDCAETATLFWFLASKRRANSKASFWFTPLMEVDLNATSPGQSVKSVFNLSS